MRYLIDSNVFFHKIKEDILTVAKSCKKNNCGMYVSPAILNELEAPKKSGYSNDCYNIVNSCVYGVLSEYKFIQLAELSADARREYQKIRNKYYRWTLDPRYLRSLIEKNILTEEDVKKVRYKDIGECELLAIAKTSKSDHYIVTDDFGKVYLHPEQNVFDFYKNDPKINILKSDEWLDDIKLE